MLDSIAQLLRPIAPVYVGYAESMADLPYIVIRPLYLSPTDNSVCGGAVAWDEQVSVYCCASSVQASYNLCKLVIEAIDGKMVDGHVASAYAGYADSLIEGHYESNVTITIMRGEL